MRIFFPFTLLGVTLWEVLVCPVHYLGHLLNETSVFEINHSLLVVEGTFTWFVLKVIGTIYLGSGLSYVVD